MKGTDMNVNYNYYTKYEDEALEAMATAVKYAPKTERISLDYYADNDVWCISGSIDYRDGDAFFSVIEKGQFSDDRYSL